MCSAQLTGWEPGAEKPPRKAEPSCDPRNLIPGPSPQAPYVPATLCRKYVCMYILRHLFSHFMLPGCVPCSRLQNPTHASKPNSNVISSLWLFLIITYSPVTPFPSHTCMPFLCGLIAAWASVYIAQKPLTYSIWH